MTESSGNAYCGNAPESLQDHACASESLKFVEMKKGDKLEEEIFRLKTTILIKI